MPDNREYYVTTAREKCKDYKYRVVFAVVSPLTVACLSAA